MAGPVGSKPVEPPEKPIAAQPAAPAPGKKDAPEKKNVPAGDTLKPPPELGTAAPAIPIEDRDDRRFVMGLRFGQTTPWLGGPALGMSHIWAAGLFPLAGDAAGSHTALVLEGSMGIGGKETRGAMQLELGASVRQTLSLSESGWQLFAQGGAIGNYLVVSDDSFRQGAVSSFGLAGRGQLGVALPVGDMGWRMEIGPYAEQGTNKREMGLIIGFSGE